MEKDQLLDLRNKIVQKTQQLAVAGQGAPADRLRVLLGLIQAGNANIEVLNKAYELSETIEGDDEKMSALLDVLYEIDARLGVINESQQPAQNQEPVHQGEENQQ